ncbi:MAG: hypothetical protein WB952_14030 [Terriglobales bacterium]
MNRVFPVIVFAILWATTASASTSTQVRNIADPVHHPYQQFAIANCTIQGDCAIVFPAMSGTRTLILHASCNFALATGNSISYAMLGIQNANPRNSLQVFANGSSSGFTAYGINSDTYLFYEKGDQPRIDVFGLGGPVQNLTCTVSGYYY